MIGAGADSERGRDSLAAKDVGGSDQRIVRRASSGPIHAKRSRPTQLREPAQGIPLVVLPKPGLPHGVG